MSIGRGEKTYTVLLKGGDKITVAADRYCVIGGQHQFSANKDEGGADTIASFEGSEVIGVYEGVED